MPCINLVLQFRFRIFAKKDWTHDLVSVLLTGLYIKSQVN